MRKIRIIGVDPSMSNLGIAKGWLDIDDLTWAVDEVGLTKTEKSKLKAIRKSDDDYERSRLLYEALSEAEEKALLAFVEMPIGSQSAAAMKSYGMCIQLIAGLDIPVIKVTPGQVKSFATGDKNATKEEMIAWATEKFPDINWLRQGKRLIGANEHLADAVGAINAGMQQEDLQAWVAMQR